MRRKKVLLDGADGSAPPKRTVRFAPTTDDRRSDQPTLGVVEDPVVTVTIERLPPRIVPEKIVVVPEKNVVEKEEGMSSAFASLLDYDDDDEDENEVEVKREDNVPSSSSVHDNPPTFVDKHDKVMIEVNSDAAVAKDVKERTNSAPAPAPVTAETKAVAQTAVTKPTEASRPHAHAAKSASTSAALVVQTDLPPVMRLASLNPSSNTPPHPGLERMR